MRRAQQASSPQNGAAENSSHRVKDSVQFRVAFTFAAIGIGLLGFTTIFIGLIIQNKILEQSTETVLETGKTIVARIGQELISTKQVARSLATIGSEMNGDHEAIRRLAPSLLSNHDASSPIAGGGIWPEPFMFSKHHERSSFFWGREHSGELKFYGDYNDPLGPGYHNEEWYVPSKVSRHRISLVSFVYRPLQQRTHGHVHDPL